MTPVETLILVLYFFVLSILAIYGWHRYYLVYLYTKNKDRAPLPPPELTTLPRVTVQLPIFNEMYVADRLIDAVCEMDYPKDLLEIQVLDDSTDETTSIAERAVRRHALRGFDIRYLHRVDRIGYKAGALEAGLAESTGDFIVSSLQTLWSFATFLVLATSILAALDPLMAVVIAVWLVSYLAVARALLPPLRAAGRRTADGRSVLNGRMSRRSRVARGGTDAGPVWELVADP